MADRRRITGPVGATVPPIYDAPPPKNPMQQSKKPENAVRKICV